MAEAVEIEGEIERAEGRLDAYDATKEPLAEIANDLAIIFGWDGTGTEPWKDGGGNGNLDLPGP